MSSLMIVEMASLERRLHQATIKQVRNQDATRPPLARLTVDGNNIVAIRLQEVVNMRTAW